MTDFIRDPKEMNRDDFMEPKLIKRLVEKIKVDPDTGCWVYQGHKNPKGYGRISYKRKNYYAHRLSHAIFLGSLPENMTLDHICNNPACVNPMHLELVTNEENLRRRYARDNGTEHKLGDDQSDIPI